MNDNSSEAASQQMYDISQDEFLEYEIADEEVEGSKQSEKEEAPNS